jgi:hypothetical protein
VATPRQIRRRGRLAIITAVFAGALLVAAVAFGAVTTSQSDYSPGSVVTISGDNSNGAGYVPGNSVDVAVSNTDTGWSDSCSATVADDGTWSCTVTLSSDPTEAVGSYSYTATSTDADGNAISESGAFTDTAPDATSTSLTITPGHDTGTPGQVYYGDTLQFQGTVTDTTNSGTTIGVGTLTVNESKQRKAGCANADFSGANIGIYSQTPASGAFDSNALSPGLSTFPATSFTSGKYYVSNFAGPPDSIYASAVGDYYFRADYSGSGSDHIAAATGDCETATVVQAPTATNSQPADGSGVTLTQVGVGVPFYVEWGVGSSYGITGNTAAGSVTLTQSGAGLGCPDGSGNAKTFTATETTGIGFSYAANSSMNNGNRFGCNATAPGNYTVYVSFVDNPETALSNPDGNYGNSDDHPGSSIIVNPVTVQACMAAPAIAAAYLKAHNVKINSPKYTNVVQEIANEMATDQQARFGNYTYLGHASIGGGGTLLRPCDTGYKSGVEAKTQYYIDQR